MRKDVSEMVRPFLIAGGLRAKSYPPLIDPTTININSLKYKS